MSARDDLSPADPLWNRAFTRMAGSPPRSGNRITLLEDAAGNYPAWLDAIAAAQSWVHFESYIINDDAIGGQFADALAAKARAGVTVRVLYDWWGARGLRPNRLWRRLQAAGVQVRCFNPPRAANPLTWMSRDHRKMIAVDGRVAFVSGLCVGQQWIGDMQTGLEGWRDTGVRLEGPAVADVERAFAAAWGAAGSALPQRECPPVGDPLPAGTVTLRVIAGTPGQGNLYRLDQLIAAAAQRSLWLTDAYFIATTPYVQALREAAADGVDVRVLVPNASDIPVIRAISLSGYRPLLEAGVRVFEWNGPMLHAKTSVADGQWARVGSTNLNPASWLGNWELDVVVEDPAFASAMAQMYERDLAHATEIVLTARRRVRKVSPAAATGSPGAAVAPGAANSTSAAGMPRSSRQRRVAGSANRAAAGAIGIGSTLGAAISNHRTLGPAEARVLGTTGALLLLIVALAVRWPWAIAGPFVVLAAWTAIVAIVKAFRIRRARPRRA